LFELCFVSGCCPIEFPGPSFDRPRVLRHLEDCLAGKAVSTLRKRGQSLLMYARWSQAEGLAPFPLREDSVYAYVTALREAKAPATRATFFLEAVNFAEHVLMLAPEGGPLSARVRGAAARCFERKRLLTQRDPLTVEQVSALELHLHDQDGKTAVFAGFVLFLVYARCRHSDAQRLEREPRVEGRYLEAGSSRTKTSSRAGRRRRLLPKAAPVEGLLGDWATRWVELRAEHGLSVALEGGLMPCPGKSGWTGRPLTAFEAGLWLKELLASLLPREALEGRNLGSHSCKATGLSWAAKAGLSHDVRRLLGYHTSSRDETGRAGRHPGR